MAPVRRVCAAVALLVVVQCGAVAAAGAEASGSGKQQRSVAGLLEGLTSSLAATSLRGVAAATSPGSNSTAADAAATAAGFCVPKLNYPVVEAPSGVTCPPGFAPTAARDGMMCSRTVSSKQTKCFRSTLECPADTVNMEDDYKCLPKEVRSALVGVLVCFRTYAELPFAILPALRGALDDAHKAALASNGTGGGASPKARAQAWLKQVASPAASNGAALPDLSALRPAPLAKATRGMATGTAELTRLLLKNETAAAYDLLAKAMLHVNVTTLMDVLPSVDEWINGKLDGLTDVNRVTAEVSAAFPDCLWRCCRESAADVRTEVVAGEPACGTPGTSYNALMKKCVSASGGVWWGDCPPKFVRCGASGPLGAPVCVPPATMWGDEACKVVASLVKALPKKACP